MSYSWAGRLYQQHALIDTHSISRVTVAKRRKVMPATIQACSICSNSTTYLPIESLEAHCLDCQQLTTALYRLPNT
jgi:hypothetical protein